MNKIVFTNGIDSSNEQVLNTLIKFRDLAEYYRYRSKSKQDIFDLMNNRYNEQLEEKVIDKNISQAINSKEVQEIIENAITKAIEKRL